MKKYPDDIKLSKNTLAGIEKLTSLYVARKVFTKDGGLQNSDELQALCQSLFLAFGADLGKHTEAKTIAEIEGHILFNLKILIIRRTACVTYYGLYDTSTKTSRYLGGRVHNNCA